MTNAALAPLHADTTAEPAEDEFTGLYRQYHPQLFRYVTHHFGARDADEITQESLARALRALDRRRTDAETWAWLIRVARNVAYDMARARRICDATDDDAVLAADLPDEHVLPEPAALLDERRRIVRRALRMLPDTQRRILVLYEVDELPCPAIARLIGANEDSVRKTLQRARRRFATEIRTIGGGVCGSVVGLLRGIPGLRRRAKALSGAGATSAVAVLAGTFALTVTAGPAIRVMHPNLDHRIAVASANVDARDAAAGQADAAASARPVVGTTSAPRRPKTVDRTVAPLVKVPKTPLSPGEKWVLVDEEVDLPVVGRTPVKVGFDGGEGHGPVCELGAPEVLGCED